MLIVMAGYLRVLEGWPIAEGRGVGSTTTVEYLREGIREMSRRNGNTECGGGPGGINGGML